MDRATARQPLTSTAPFASEQPSEREIQAMVATFAPEAHPPGREAQRTGVWVALLCISLSVVAVGWMGVMVGGIQVGLGAMVVAVLAGSVRALPSMYVVALRRADRRRARELLMEQRRRTLAGR